MGKGSGSARTRLGMAITTALTYQAMCYGREDSHRFDRASRGVETRRGVREAEDDYKSHVFIMNAD